MILQCKIDIATESCLLQSAPIVHDNNSLENTTHRNMCLSFDAKCESCKKSTKLTFCRKLSYDGSYLTCWGLGYVGVGSLENWSNVKVTVPPSQHGIIMHADGVNGTLLISDIDIASHGCNNDSKYLGTHVNKMTFLFFMSVYAGQVL